MEDLALGLGVSVVASLHLAVAGEGGVGNLGENGVVVSGHPGNSFLQGAFPAAETIITEGPLLAPVPASSEGVASEASSISVGYYCGPD